MGLQVSLRRAGGLVALGSITANLLQYAFLIGLSRLYAPDVYGALSAVLGVGSLAGIVAGTLQLVVARQAAGGLPRVTLGRASVVGVLLATVTCAAAPLGMAALHLGTVWPMVWLGVSLLPQTLAGALAGVLLGHERFLRFAIAQVTLSGCRVLVLPLIAWAGWGATGAVAAVAVATVAASGILLGMVAGTWPWRPWLRRSGPVIRELGRAASGVAGFAVLTSADLLLARHFLTPAASGLYAVATLFTRAGLWGTQFIALTAYPRLTGGGWANLLRKAAMATAALGVAGALLAQLLGKALVLRLNGEAYVGVAPYVGWFVLLGTVMALVNLRLVAGIAQDSGTYQRLIWIAVVIEATVVALLPHATVAGIATVASAVCLGLVVVGFARLPRTGPKPAHVDPLPS